MNSSRRRGQKPVTITCDPCRFAGKASTLAVKYCLECHGHFCQPCTSAHSNSVATRYHKYTDLRDNHKPSNSSKRRSKYRCKEHDSEFVSFCEGHDVVCCHVCITSIHKTCARITPLSDTSFDAKAVKLAKDLESVVKKLQTQFWEAKNAKLDYIKAVEYQDQTFIASLKSFRRSIDITINKLEDATIKHKDTLLQQKLDMVNGHIKTFDLADVVLMDVLKQLGVSLLNREPDMFLGVKHVEDIVTEYKAVYETLKQTPDKGHLRFEPDLNIQTFLTSAGMLGDVSLEAAAPSKSASQRSLMTSKISTLPPSFRKPELSKDVNVRVKTDKFPCYITGVTVLPDDRVFLADDSNKCVKLLGNEYAIQTSHPLTSAPRDVTAISGGEVAATIPDEKCIQIFDVGLDSLTRKRKLVLNTGCYGITFHETMMYVTSGWSPEKEVQVIEPSGKVMQIINLPHVMFKYPLYIDVDSLSDTIFVTDYMHGVIALDMTGTVIGKYEDSLHSKGHYKGVAITLPGHVLVSTWQNNGICRLDPDGKSMPRVIEWEPKERRKPVAIAYGFESKKLFVSYCGEKRDFLSVYKVQ